MLEKSPENADRPENISQAPSCYAFAFVCQKGDLEGLALLLAASLKRFLRCDYEIIAAVPRPDGPLGDLNPITYRLLNEMGVRIEYFDNSIAGNQKGDLLTNKIYCFQIPTAMDKIIFLDSDMLCLREFSGNQRFATPFNAAPTFLATGKNWGKVYQAAGVPLPTRQIPTLFSNELQPPYFNSGFVAIHQSLARDLFDHWMTCFSRINAEGVMDDNLYFREQVSLSVALMKMGIDYDVLDETYNFWVKARPLNEQHLPYFLHHTWPFPPVYHQPILIDLVRSLVAEYPDMKPFVAKTRWKYYLRPDWVTAVNRGLFRKRALFHAVLGEPLAEAIVNA
jgi:hypothetical protein